MLTEWIVKENK